MDSAEIRIMVVDDHQIFIEGLKYVLGKQSVVACNIVGQAGTGGGILKMLEQSPIDLLMVDIGLPDMDGLELIAKVKESGYQFRIITLSMYSEPKIVRAAFRAGTDGYLLKSSTVSELMQALKTVLEGETYMSTGLSLTQASGANYRLIHNDKLSVAYDDRIVKKFNLTKRELEVLKLIGQAKTNKEIAVDLYISDQTVSVHRKNIMRKMGVGNTASLIKMAYENNLF